jgi:hypothetical protein
MVGGALDSLTGVLPMSFDFRSRARDFLSLARDARAIADSDATWESKYDVIFPGISRAVSSLGFAPDYCDPDTSYQEDVEAYVYAIQEKAEEVRKMLDAITSESF